MNTLKAYAHQVVSYHPARVRDSMFEELYDNLCEEFADWKVQNPEGTEESFLDECKEHPMRYATRFAPEGAAYLIGPRFYYSFVNAVKIAATAIAGIYIAIAAVMAFATGKWFGSALHMAAEYPSTLLWVSAVILGVFVALERSGETAVWMDKWKAADLPRADSHQTISRADAVFDLAVSTFGLLLIFRVVQIPPVTHHDGSLASDWGLAVPDALLWIAATLFAVELIFALLRMTRSLWTRGLRAMTITVNLAWLAVLGYAAALTPLLTLTPAPDELADVLTLFNQVARGVLAVVCVVLIVDVAKHTWRLLRNRNTGT